MAGEVKSAAEATRIAASFLKQYYGFLRPTSATKRDGSWTVKIDVGVIEKQVASVEVDATTGEVMDYSLPI